MSFSATVNGVSRLKNCIRFDCCYCVMVGLKNNEMWFKDTKRRKKRDTELY